MSAGKKLKDLGITLPRPPQPIANYVRAVRVGDLRFVSGHGPYNDGKIKMATSLIPTVRSTGSWSSRSPSNPPSLSELQMLLLFILESPKAL